jgi:16S rRNA (uracil1498-N3)-methyltransferase
VFWTFVEPSNIRAGEVLIEGSRAHHLGRVLRVQPGEKGVVVAEGREYSVVVGSVHRDQVLTRILESRTVSNEPKIRVTLLQSLLPNADFDAVIEATTAVGITRLVAVQAARSVVRSGPDRLPRWATIAESAAAQSHRGRVPEVLGPLSLSSALAGFDRPLLVLDPQAGERLEAPPDGVSGVTFAVGPEGGWTDAELAEFALARARPVSLGPRILRARLAPVVATAILVAQR